MEDWDRARKDKKDNESNLEHTEFEVTMGHPYNLAGAWLNASRAQKRSLCWGK